MTVRVESPAGWTPLARCGKFGLLVLSRCYALQKIGDHFHEDLFALGILLPVDLRSIDASDQLATAMQFISEGDLQAFCREMSPPWISVVVVDGERKDRYQVLGENVTWPEPLVRTLH